VRSSALIRLLCFCLLFVPVGASLHAFSHASEALASASLMQHGDEVAPAPDRCEICLAYAAMSAGMVPAALLLLSFLPAMQVATASVVRNRATLRVSYLSRAPPLSV